MHLTLQTDATESAIYVKKSLSSPISTNCTSDFRLAQRQFENWKKIRCLVHLFCLTLDQSPELG